MHGLIVFLNKISKDTFTLPQQLTMIAQEPWSVLRHLFQTPAAYPGSASILERKEWTNL
jgi:hypothetical protein